MSCVRLLCKLTTNEKWNKSRREQPMEKLRPSCAFWSVLQGKNIEGWSWPNSNWSRTVSSINHWSHCSRGLDRNIREHTLCPMKIRKETEDTAGGEKKKTSQMTKIYYCSWPPKSLRNQSPKLVYTTEKNIDQNLTNFARTWQLIQQFLSKNQLCQNSHVSLERREVGVGGEHCCLSILSTTL